MTETDEIEAPETKIETETPETGEQTQANGRDYEAEALASGWTPKDNFKGPADKWKDAETFIKDGERYLPLVKSQLEKERAARLKDKADMEAKYERLSRANHKAYESKLAELKAAQIERVAEGDVDGYKALGKSIASLEHEQLPENPGSAPADAFKAENPWYGVDGVMTAAAQAISQEIYAANPGIAPEKELAMVRVRMEQEFPHKFQKPASRAAAVDGGGDFPGFRSENKQAFSNLPADGKSAFATFVRQGVYQNNATDQARYAKDYHNG